MAKVKVEMPEEFLRKLSLLGSKTDEIAGRVLEAGGEVVLAKVRSNLSSVIGSGTKYDSRSTGELERSLGLTPPLVDRDGNHNIKVGFAEPRSDGGRSFHASHGARRASVVTLAVCDVELGSFRDGNVTKAQSGQTTRFWSLR